MNQKRTLCQIIIFLITMIFFFLSISTVLGITTSFFYGEITDSLPIIQEEELQNLIHQYYNKPNNFKILITKHFIPRDINKPGIEDEEWKSNIQELSQLHGLPLNFDYCLFKGNYNNFNTQELDTWFKNREDKKLPVVYFKPRKEFIDYLQKSNLKKGKTITNSQIMKLAYPQEWNKLTLSDILPHDNPNKYAYCIQQVIIFLPDLPENQKEKIRPSIETVRCIDFEETLEENINTWLQSQNKTTRNLIIEPYSFNNIDKMDFLHTFLHEKTPPITYQNQNDIDPVYAIYFDGGVRLFKSGCSSKHLLDRETSANKIYLFKRRRKDLIQENLEPSFQPRQTIKKWMNDNISYPIKNIQEFNNKVEFETKYYYYNICCNLKCKERRTIRLEPSLTPYRTIHAWMKTNVFNYYLKKEYSFSHIEFETLDTIYDVYCDFKPKNNKRINLNPSFTPENDIRTWMKINVSDYHQKKEHSFSHIEYETLDTIYDIYCPLKETRKIDLYPSLTPEVDIRNWMEGRNYTEKKYHSPTHIEFETFDVLYDVYCPIDEKEMEYQLALQEYEKALQDWKNQCYFQPGLYSGETIRNKFGQGDRTVYCLDSRSIINTNTGEFAYARPSDDYRLEFNYNFGTWWTPDKFYLKRYYADRCTYFKGSDSLIILQ